MLQVLLLRHAEEQMEAGMGYVKRAHCVGSCPGQCMTPMQHKP